MTTVTDVIKNALALPLKDRSYIASKLIESLEEEELSPDAIREYDRRVAGWRSGRRDCRRFLRRVQKGA
jgi:hypothetical protein